MKLPESGTVSRIPYLTKYNHTSWIYFLKFYTFFENRVDQDQLALSEAS